MKKIICSFLILSLLSLAGCKQDVPPAQATETEITTAVTENTPEIPTDTAVPFEWTQLQSVRFLFASGAGAWGTVLYIHPDGSFSGNYRDSNSYTGPGYPNGSVSYSDFTGQFSQPVQIDPYTYSLKLEMIGYKNPIGTEQIRDGTLYNYVSAYGLTDTEEFLLFLPGTPVTELPEYFRIWFAYELDEATCLPFYGLYNVDQEQSFSGKDVVQQILDSVAAAEKADQEIEADLQKAFTQADMNTAAYNRYLIWDNVLNELWAVLKQLLDEDTMRQLTNEELVWIQEKEQAMTEAGAEYEGGSMQPAVVNGTAANLTKERVYVLLEYLP